MKKRRLFSFENLCRALALVLRAIFYVFVMLFALLIVATPIVAVAGAPAEKMLLPPFMREAESGYTISLGNGIKMFVQKDAAVAAKIKSALCFTFLLWAAYLAASMPALWMLSRLCANLRDGRLYDPKNPAYIKYVGLAVIASSIVLSLLERYYNFKLIELFAAGGGDAGYAPGIDILPVAEGLIFMLLAAVYDKICCEKEGGALQKQAKDGA